MGGAVLRTPKFIDTRTGEPVSYPALLDEAVRLAETEGLNLAVACSRVAQEANIDGYESIAKGLRRQRARRDRAVAAAETPERVEQPIPGYGVLWSDLADYARRIETEIRDAMKYQSMSSYRMTVAGKRAEAVLRIAKERRAFLDSVGRERAAELLRPLLGGVDGLDESQQPAAFYDAEMRRLEVILHTTERVLEMVRSAVGYLPH